MEGFGSEGRDVAQELGEALPRLFERLEIFLGERHLCHIFWGCVWQACVCRCRGVIVAGKGEGGEGEGEGMWRLLLVCVGCQLEGSRGMDDGVCERM